MARQVDHSPVGHTCPSIDTIISYLDRLPQDFDSISHREVKDMIYILEELRSQNSTLRDWGNEQYTLREDLEGEVDELLGKIETLENELTEYKQQD